MLYIKLVVLKWAQQIHLKELGKNEEDIRTKIEFKERGIGYGNCNCWVWSSIIWINQFCIWCLYGILWFFYLFITIKIQLYMGTILELSNRKFFILLSGVFIQITMLIVTVLLLYNISMGYWTYYIIFFNYRTCNLFYFIGNIIFT